MRPGPPAATVPSPCISVCVIDPPTGLCAGCYRTLEEIAAWIDLSAEERKRVLAALPERRARHQQAIEARTAHAER
ncbi:MAG TPA: DUF1289 domain-containing protein [Casimicrobiaceae bacterium]|nr:DUF1289 domain-containing protein [Casimicrobiaceae bacterium]